MLEDSRDTEISDLDLIRLRHEYVLGLQITMQDLAIVDVLDSQAHLHEPVENLVFGVHDYIVGLRYKEVPFPIFF